MGLRCSLFGHDYGDPVAEREREERGAEVVVTEREVRACRRCGAETVVSENTRVERQPEVADRDDAEPAADEAERPIPEPTPDERADDAIILENERPPGELAPEPDDEPPADEGSPVPTAEAEAADEADEESLGDTDPSPTGAEAVMEAESSGETDPTAETESADVAPWPDPADAEPAAGDDNAPDAGEDLTWPTDAPVEQAWPADPSMADEGEAEPSAGAGSDFQFDQSVVENGQSAHGDETPSGIRSKGPIESTGGGDDLAGTLDCPNCGFSVPMARSSLRAGDICPDCHAGYLAEER